LPHLTLYSARLVRPVVVLLSLIAAFALASSAAPSVEGSVPPIKSFKLPGNKVRCVIVGGTTAQGAGALCIAILNAGVRPFPRPQCDVGDPGGGLSIGLTGRSKGLCLSENPIVPPVRLLRYGRSITVGGIACAAISRSAGVRCENANLHGFQISPSGWSRF
jgi:hypothetical protein